MTFLIWKETRRRPDQVILITLFFLVHTLLRAGDFTVFEIDGKYGLKDEESGEVIIPAQYQSLGWSNSKHSLPHNGCIGYLEKDRWGLISVSNKRITSPAYIAIEPFKNGLFKVSKPHRRLNLPVYGLIDKKGRIEVSVDYTSLEAFGLKYLVKNYVEGGEKAFLLDSDGEKTGISGMGMEVYHEVLALFDNKDILLLDANLDTILPFPVDSVDLRKETLIFAQNGNFGAVDRKGRILLPAIYQNIQTEQFPKIRAFPSPDWLKIDSAYHFSDTLHHILDPLYRPEQFFTPNYRIVKKKNRWGIQDGSGQVVLNYMYDSIFGKVEVGFIVKFRNEYGIIREDGDWSFFPQPYPIWKVQDSMVFLRQNGMYRLTDLKNNLLSFAEVPMSVKGNFLFVSDSVSQIETKSGELLQAGVADYLMISPDSVYTKKDNHFYLLSEETVRPVREEKGEEQLIAAGDGFITIERNGKMGAVDHQLRLRIANRYDSLRPFVDGLAAFRLRGRWGFIDKSDLIIIQPNFDWVSNFFSGLAIVKDQQQMGLVDKEGDLAYPLEADSIYRNGDFFMVIKNGEMGMLGPKGEVLLQERYQSLNPVNQEVVIAEKRDEKGLLYKTGLNVTPFMFSEIRYQSNSGNFYGKLPPQWEQFDFSYLYR